jgi:hypothetical protein
MPDAARSAPCGTRIRREADLEAAGLLLVELSTALEATALADAMHERRDAPGTLDEAQLEAVGTARPRRCEHGVDGRGAEPCCSPGAGVGSART